MATLLPALLAKYDSLTASGFANADRPPAYHDKAPQVTSGAQLRTPYTVFSLTPGEELLTFEEDDVEETRVTVRVYDTDENNLDLAVAAVRFNGQTKSAHAGFDGGTLPDLSDGTLLAVLPLRPPVKRFEGKNLEGKNVYVAELEYAVTVQRS